MKLKTMNQPLFYQYLLSYLFILIIPLSIIAGLVYTFFVSELEQQAKDYNERLLIQLQNNVDIHMMDIVRISVKLSSEPGLSPYSLENIYSAYQAKKILNYPETNAFFEDLLLYVPSNSMFYSSISTYSKEMFFKHVYRCDSVSYETYLNELDQTQGLTIRQFGCTVNDEQTRNNDVMVIAPIPFGSAFAHSKAIFLIKEDTFQNLFRTISSYPNSMTMILDEEGNVIISSAHDSSFLTAEIREEISSGKAKGTDTVKLPDGLFYLSYVNSKDVGLTYLSLVPQAELMKTVKKKKNIAIIAFGFTLLLGGLLIYIMMRMNYKPLHNLIHWTEEQTKGFISNNSRGIERIRSAIYYVDQRSDQLSMQLKYSHSFAKEHLLTSLLKGKLKNEAYLREQGKHLDIHLPPSTYFVMIVQTDPAVNEADMGSLPAHWKDAFDADLYGYQVNMYEGRDTAWIIEGDPQRMNRSQWEEMLNSFAQHISAEVIFGIGNACSDLMQLSQSYLEAYTSLFHKPMTEGNQIYFYPDITKENKDAIWYPKAQLAKLDLIIKQGEPNKVIPVLDEIIDQIKENHTPFLMAKYIGFDIVNTISKMNARSDYSKEMLQIMEINSFDELQQALYVFCNEMVLLMEEVEGQRKPEMLVLIESYVGEAAYFNQFSIKVMAQDLSISTAYLGRYFKDQTGMTLMDYVTELRIERAKKLLAESEMPLQDIVQQIGFTDVSSFIRKFKGIVSMTPGEYRLLVKKD